jgi:thiosulfate/3-mercaptopyruvate sulfurtransferase
MMDSLVSTEWLDRQLGASDLSIVDCTWHMPASGRDGRAEYRQVHIPGAVFLDIDAVADRTQSAPHMLPSADAFSAAASGLGVSSKHRIVVYDNSPHHTAVRGWFMFRHFGAKRVAVLDGGLAKWIADGRRIAADAPQPAPSRFAAEPRCDVVAKADVLGSHIILDARSRARFEGSEADPREGVAAGHIPGSRSLPFAELYREDGTFKPLDEVRAVFASAGVDPMEPFVATCGSGVTANSLIFAAHRLGNNQAKLYDGSWSEWGADPATPKALGPA